MGGAVDKTALGASQVSLGNTLGSYARAMPLLLSPNFRGDMQAWLAPKNDGKFVPSHAAFFIAVVTIEFIAIIILSNK